MLFCLFVCLVTNLFFSNFVIPFKFNCVVRNLYYK